MKNLSQKFDEINSKISSSDNIFITMSKPDGDSIGSGLALYKYLQSLSKKVTIQSSFFIPTYLQFLEQTKEIIIQDVGLVDFSKYDLVLFVDAGESHRAVDKLYHPDGWNFPGNTFIACFDHHPSHDFEFSQIDLYNDELSSTCEIVTNYFQHIEFNLSPEIATFLYLGIYTDSGGFKYNNAKANTFKSVAYLLESGADKEFILDKLNRPMMYDAILIVSRILKDFEIVKEEKYSYVIATYPYEFALNTPIEVIEEVLNIIKSYPGYISNIANTDFGLLIMDTGKLRKVSFRSRNQVYELNKICEVWGGGGHKAAAAFATTEDVETLKGHIKKEVKNVLG